MDQRAGVLWNGSLSLINSNGVRQGGVLSPIYFWNLRNIVKELVVFGIIILLVLYVMQMTLHLMLLLLLLCV